MSPKFMDEVRVMCRRIDKDRDSHAHQTSEATAFDVRVGHECVLLRSIVSLTINQIVYSCTDICRVDVASCHSHEFLIPVTTTDPKLPSITTFMFGDPLRPLAMATKRSPEDLKIIEETLSYIAANLHNIRNVFGVSSEQYESASSILDQFKAEMKKKNIDEAQIEQLMQKMSLDEPSSTPNANKAKS